MGAVNKSTATLRIFGDDLDPDEVTRLLGKIPDAAERRGEAIRTRSGRERIALRGSWRVKAKECSPEDLDAQITELLAGTTKDLAVWQRLTRLYTVDVFSGLFMEEKNEGISISPETLQKLGERGIKLGLDIYAPD